jgi:hypothetical protein
MSNIHYIAVLLLVLLSFLQTNKAQGAKPALIGTWVFDFNRLLKLASKAFKKHYNTIESSRKTKLFNTYNNQDLTFNHDGLYPQKMSAGEMLIAFWTLNNDTLEIIILNEYNLGFVIKEVTTTKLMLNQILDNNRARKLFTSWYLLKK